MQRHQRELRHRRDERRGEEEMCMTSSLGVFDSRQASTLRLYQSMMATR